MNKSLFTDSELSLLLQRARSGARAGRVSASPKRVELYDFQSAGRLSAVQLAKLSEAHAPLSDALGKSLSRLLGFECKVTCKSAEQMEYGDFVKIAPEAVVFGMLRAQSPEAESFLYAELPAILPTIDLMLGGAGDASEAPRPLTDVEEEIFKPVVELFSAELQAAWAPHVKSCPRYACYGEALGAVPSEKNIMALPFEIQFGEFRGEWNLILPPQLASALIRKSEQQATAPEIAAGEGTDRRLRERLLESRFRLELSLPPTAVSVRSLARLKEGQVVLLKQRANEPIDVSVEGIHLFQAAAVSCGEYRGAQIKQALPAPKIVEKEKR
jgi:flagellar motor switch protein FliM